MSNIDNWGHLGGLLTGAAIGVAIGPRFRYSWAAPSTAAPLPFGAASRRLFDNPIIRVAAPGSDHASARGHVATASAVVVPRQLGARTSSGSAPRAVWSPSPLSSKPKVPSC
jgi:hypothetical protein